MPKDERYENWRKAKIGNISDEEFRKKIKSLSQDGGEQYRLEALYDESKNHLTLQGNSVGLNSLRAMLDDLIEYGVTGRNYYLAEYHHLSKANISILIRLVDND